MEAVQQEADAVSLLVYIAKKGGLPEKTKDTINTLTQLVWESWDPANSSLFYKIISAAMTQ